MKGMESEHPNTWRIEITAPLGIGAELRDSLFTAVADAVHDWQPEDRCSDRGWRVASTEEREDGQDDESR